jgi:hypothetical protein
MVKFPSLGVAAKLTGWIKVAHHKNSYTKASSSFQINELVILT